MEDIDLVCGKIDIPIFLLAWFSIVQNMEISKNSQAILSGFWIRNSFTSMDSNSSNNTTDEHKGGIFGEYSSDKETSIQLLTDMNG